MLLINHDFAVFFAFPAINMKQILVLVVLFGALLTCQGIDNFMDHPMYDCIRCLCHARSGCWIRQNCARYSINKQYWKTAGSLSVNDNLKTGKNSDVEFRKCMANENCIVGTIIKYTESFGRLDCNCDGKYDCKDRLAIHLFGSKCESPKFGQTYASRFNHCAARIGVDTMLSSEGTSDCDTPPAV